MFFGPYEGAIGLLVPYCRDQPGRVVAMLMVLINIVIVIVVGAILFYLIDKYVRDGRLGNLLKILVALICLAAILQRLLPTLGVSGL
jgi:uncharacterized membrane protein required for colicin V production